MTRMRGEPAPVENWEVPEQPLGGAGNRGNGRDAPPDRYQRRAFHLRAADFPVFFCRRQANRSFSKDEPALQPELSPMFTAKIKSGYRGVHLGKQGNAPCRSLGLFPPPRSGNRGRAGHDPKRYGAAAACACPADHRFWPACSWGTSPHRKAPSRSCMN